MTEKPDTSAEAVERPAYLIRKGAFWYRPHKQGYTSSAIQAGRYTLDEALKITFPNGPDGPRDGMVYFHEDTLNDADWRAYTALAAERDALKARAEAAKAEKRAAYVAGTNSGYAAGVEAAAKACDCRDREAGDSMYIRGCIDSSQANARRIRAMKPEGKE